MKIITKTVPYFKTGSTFAFVWRCGGRPQNPQSEHPAARSISKPDACGIQHYRCTILVDLGYSGLLGKDADCIAGTWLATIETRCRLHLLVEGSIRRRKVPSNLNQADPIHALQTHFSKIHFNIILPPKPEPSKWSPSLGFPQPKRCVHPYLLHTLHISVTNRVICNKMQFIP